MRFTSALRNILIPFFVPIILIFSILTTNIYGGEKKMEPLYDINDTSLTLKPQIFKIGAYTRHSLFPVPQDNAVGTNDHKDAITIISFPKGKIDMDNYFKRAVEDVRGSGTYLPVISQDEIGFGQTRRFLIYNFKSKKHEEYRIVYSFDDTIEKIAIADAEKKRFIFEIESHNPQSNDPWDSKYFLYLVDLSEKKVNVIKRIDIGKGSVWAVADGRLFLWYFDEKEIQVYDRNLEPSQHPMADIIKKNKNKMDFLRMYLHPFLPFAILSGGKEGTSFISWEEGKVNIPERLIRMAKEYSFSPDGKWVAFQCGILDEKKTYLMPVSEKYPNYLGTPILLWDDSFGRNNFAWSKNPISFVGSDGDIYRWELTNEAHPESDKPTFHDYIVEKDIERLAKEKKQGLGKE